MSDVHRAERIRRNVPDYALGRAVTPASAGATDTLKHPTAGRISCRSPNIGDSLHPLWYRYGSNMSALADKIDDGPVLFPLLGMIGPGCSRARLPDPFQTMTWRWACALPVHIGHHPSSMMVSWPFRSSELRRDRLFPMMT